MEAITSAQLAMYRELNRVMDIQERSANAFWEGWNEVSWNDVLVEVRKLKIQRVVEQHKLAIEWSFVA